MEINSGLSPLLPSEATSEDFSEDLVVWRKHCNWHRLPL